MNKTNRNWFGWAEWVVVISAFVITLGVAAIIFPAFRAFIASGNTANWAAAIGSLAAACTAVWAATYTARQQRLRERISAALTVRALRPDIEQIRDGLIRMKSEIKQAVELKSQADQQIAEQGNLLKELRFRYDTSKVLTEAAPHVPELDMAEYERLANRFERERDDAEFAFKRALQVEGEASTTFDQQTGLIKPLHAILSEIDVAPIHSYSISLGTQIELAVDDLRTCIKAPLTFDHSAFLCEQLQNAVDHLDLFLRSQPAVTEFLERQARADD